MGVHLIKGLNPLLQYVADLMSVFQIKPIAEPQKYRDKVLAAKDVLKHDVSGLVNTILDFAVARASSVNYRVDTDDPKVTEVLNEWLANINSQLRGRVPTGIEALSKEYFRERWKGSSHLLMRTMWETDKETGLYLPTTMFFLDGEDIIVNNADDEIIRLGDEKYSIRITQKKNIPVPEDKDEMIYVQTPYDAWGTREPRPFLIRRGLWHNLMFMRMLSEKGEFVVARALEYLFLIKKGTEKMFIDGNISYTRDDLEKISKDFQELLAKKKYEIPVINGLPTGAPTYATQFDTSMEHLIPDYSKVINEALFVTIERRLLAGLGMVDILEGAMQSSRKETVMNPKPFISEVKQGVADFENMLRDVMSDIVEKNLKKKKWKKSKIRITCSTIPEFLSDESKTLLRSLYDRGLLSKRTVVEVCGDMGYDNEVQRRIDEDKSGEMESMYPPVIQNQPTPAGMGGGDPRGVKEPADKSKKDIDNVPEDKKGPEKKNYKGAEAGEVFALPTPQKPYDKPTMVSQPQGTDLVIEKLPFPAETPEPPLQPNEIREETPIANLPPEDIYEEAPYKTNKDLPPAVRKYPAGAQTAFRKAWMNAYRTYKDEQTAFKVAWSVLKKHVPGYVELPEQHGTKE